MHRFYLPPEKHLGTGLRLEGREAHHAIHVLRLERGAPITLLDGCGTRYSCRVENTSKHCLSLDVTDREFVPAPSCPATLFIAVPKGKIMEEIIQKGVELGVQRFVPLLTERVVVRLSRDEAETKREKWQQIAVEAIKQCGAAWLPRIEAPAELKKVLAGPGKPELMLVGSLQTERKHPRDWISQHVQQHRRPPASAGIWIGPEGDFTLTEIQAIEAAGAKAITLGSLTLRVETAAICCLSFLNYELSWLEKNSNP